ncbi:MAG: peptide deformylase [Candidatus Omnitrophica bacterium]|nr:peptide deformylase [Candidatus Omnitrophota bacterium]
MIPKLNIRTYGDPVLRKKASAVLHVGSSERMLIKAMWVAMYENKGVGLAAPQVGISQQIFVADVGDGPIAIINPKILKKSGSEKMEEGCLSIPDIKLSIRRPKEILVQYTDENNQKIERHLTDLLARVFMHENDHLNGKLIIDYATLAQKARLRKKLLDIKNKVH